MGYFRHHAICVTSYSGDAIYGARLAAFNIGLAPTDITLQVTNGYRSFFIPPDGSKEGWEASDRANERRAKFTDWLIANGAAIDWVEVEYGGDGEGASVVQTGY